MSGAARATGRRRLSGSPLREASTAPDSSGVYKLQAYADAPQLAQVLRGRTTMEMSGEVKMANRVGVESLEPGDVLFFGGHGPRSTTRRSTSGTAG